MRSKSGGAHLIGHLKPLPSSNQLSWKIFTFMVFLSFFPHTTVYHSPADISVFTVPYSCSHPVMFPSKSNHLYVEIKLHIYIFWRVILDIVKVKTLSGQLQNTATDKLEGCGGCYGERSLPSYNVLGLLFPLPDLECSVSNEGNQGTS